MNERNNDSKRINKRTTHRQATLISPGINPEIMNKNMLMAQAALKGMTSSPMTLNRRSMKGTTFASTSTGNKTVRIKGLNKIPFSLITLMVCPLNSSQIASPSVYLLKFG
jgi:predicted solute-binding protein